MMTFRYYQFKIVYFKIFKTHDSVSSNKKTMEYSIPSDFFIAIIAEEKLNATLSSLCVDKSI